MTIACNCLHCSFPPTCYHLASKGPYLLKTLTLDEKLACLDEVAVMKQGWLGVDDEGDVATPEVIEKVKTFLENYPEFQAHIYPMITGGVQLEWDREDEKWGCGLAFHNDGCISYLAIDNQNPDIDVTALLSKASTQQIIDFIQNEKTNGRA